MYEFFDRLVATALPRIRDFRGLSPRSFDGRGNYSLGVSATRPFSRKSSWTKSNGSRAWTSRLSPARATDEEALELLKMMGMPLRGRK